VFTFGGIKGQVGAAEAQKEQALLGYQQTVLNAFRETNDALTGAEKKARESAEQQKRVEALRDVARLSRIRFDRGITGYLDVLIAENELFAGELAATRLLAERNAQVIGVYRAVGGGWVDLSSAMVTDAGVAATSAAPADAAETLPATE
jgi:multidrug efflux system outer membrane protein